MLRIGCLDTAATEAAVGVDEGYDHIFNEPARVDDDSQFGVSARQETERFMTAQLEPQVMDQLHKYVSGDSRDASITAVAHYKDLERDGQTREDGTLVFQVNDRLVEIMEVSPGNPSVMTIPEAPGLYITSITPTFGFGTKRNLVQITFKARPQAK